MTPCWMFPTEFVPIIKTNTHTLISLHIKTHKSKMPQNTLQGEHFHTCTDGKRQRLEQTAEIRYLVHIYSDLL